MFEDNLTEQCHYDPKSNAWAKRIEEISNVQSNNELTLLLCNTVRDLGFDYGTIFVVAEGDSFILRKRIITTLPTRLQETLLSDKANNIRDICTNLHDPKNLHYCISKFGPELQHNFLTQFSRSRIAFQLNFSSKRYAIVVLDSDKTDVDLRNNYTKYSVDYEVIFSEILDSFCFLNQVGSACDKLLTNDEIKFLRTLLISSDPNQAVLQNYSYGSAKTIRSSIARKLGVTSIFQALGVAIKNDLLSNEYFIRSEIVNLQTELLGL